MSLLEPLITPMITITLLFAATILSEGVLLLIGALGRDETSLNAI